MAVSSQKFQAPKGTRDFYPADLAVRRHIENVWRQVSINHGFDEIDGPAFEHLDLYTHKSGPGIVSELFQVMSGKDAEQLAAIRAGESAPYALRPEFTPTLARMVAARAPELPRPIKWFAIPSHFRAESPQRGRLREFMQWNVDFIGDTWPWADAEVIATAVTALKSLGLTSGHVVVKVNDRSAVQKYLLLRGIPEGNIESALQLLDNRSRLSRVELVQQMSALGAADPEFTVDSFDETKGATTAPFVNLRGHIESLRVKHGDRYATAYQDAMASLSPFYEPMRQALEEYGVGDWCWFNKSVVRGLAYYTGTVFEIIAEGERAIAGGGRYDKLIEGFGGPSLPACGFGMGDVVLANILKDKGLLKPAEEYLPRPDAFVIAANDDAAAKMPAIVADLRRQNLHVRQSYKATRNVGKLLGDAGKVRARYAVILGTELAASPARVALKNMDSGEQREIALNELAVALRAAERHSPSLEGGG